MIHFPILQSVPIHPEWFGLPLRFHSKGYPECQDRGRSVFLHICLKVLVGQFSLFLACCCASKYTARLSAIENRLYILELQFAQQEIFFTYEARLTSLYLGIRDILYCETEEEAQDIRDELAQIAQLENVSFHWYNGTVITFDEFFCEALKLIKCGNNVHFNPVLDVNVEYDSVGDLIIDGNIYLDYTIDFNDDIMDRRGYLVVATIELDKKKRQTSQFSLLSSSQTVASGSKRTT